jgi:hypothetical protein
MTFGSLLDETDPYGTSIRYAKQSGRSLTLLEILEFKPEDEE